MKLLLMSDRKLETRVLQQMLQPTAHAVARIQRELEISQSPHSPRRQNRANVAATDVRSHEELCEVLQDFCLEVVTAIGVQPIQRAVHSLLIRGPPYSTPSLPSTGDQGDADRPPRPGKQARIDCIRSSGRCVYFDEVFDNDHAQRKKTLVQHPKVPSSWYILRCDEHDIDFRHKAFLRAGAHLSSAQHGRLSRDSEVVIEHFGTEVLNCDEGLVAMNNASGHTVLCQKRKHKRQSARMTQKRRKHAEYDPLADPSAGQLYRGL
ncbi:uncharacterized protein F5Z01DRAFT_495584 [Emericellopsis atlantica]|uniref:Uncharacterized protein n=1 Tax=Emericellopsis atlantica TaxID=2614577 RepID=A0A9P7ZCD4_9HYPO|nr:uncharacterized protein F5Z01DRAFT_495584 [Emericellopsis atlantica]KAG9249504.1 hypothetical protein F5Z01DRAFT_495584 [Emericellopsis atlantica]